MTKNLEVNLDEVIMLSVSLQRLQDECGSFWYSHEQDTFECLMVKLNELKVDMWKEQSERAISENNGVIHIKLSGGGVATS